MKNIGGESPIQLSRLGGRFKVGDSNSMVSESLEEYALDYSEAAYEDSGKQAPVEFMALG